jgi:hypothetical protein
MLAWLKHPLITHAPAPVFLAGVNITGERKAGRHGMKILESPTKVAPERAGDDLAELRLDGRAALITGGARGIGEAIARRLGTRGAGVAIFDIDGERLQQTASALAGIGLDVLALTGSVTNSADADAAVAACVDRWGRLDILVNNAGVGGRSMPIWEMDDQEWLRVLDIDQWLLLFLPGSHPPHAFTRLWADRQYRLHRRQGRKPKRRSVLNGQGWGDRPHKESWQRARHPGYPRECYRAGGD